MPDITMCDSKICEVRGRCRRSPYSGTMPDRVGQSWTCFYGAQDKFGEDCIGFMQVRDAKGNYHYEL